MTNRGDERRDKGRGETAEEATIEVAGEEANGARMNDATEDEEKHRRKRRLRWRGRKRTTRGRTTRQRRRRNGGGETAEEASIEVAGEEANDGDERRDRGGGETAEAASLRAGGGSENAARPQRDRSEVAMRWWRVAARASCSGGSSGIGEARRGGGEVVAKSRSCSSGVSAIQRWRFCSVGKVTKRGGINLHLFFSLFWFGLAGASVLPPNRS
ncbi:hypothetical protein LR48_Vigan02g019900 [Vigna angularis]|uniref:Uncharacterized protein n=1 Tax=Phaseolus angularis TaxID=3914 RepID=A0A0L9TV53_PHAAN|nr:hypothetical protein LR48_Vigan02g019900 [Vigna angularis]